MSPSNAAVSDSPGTVSPETVIEMNGSPGKSQIPKVSISWENVNFQVKIKNPSTKKFETKQILSDVCGCAAPGELMVLMGPSGAGKSSLLDCIAGRNPDCTGSILVNGKPWSKGVAKHSCYVMQDDLFYANLTVMEHLTFQAELRMGRVCSKQERKQRVDTIISELGLTKVINTPIGDALVKGLSGGQRKRLSFATELLTNPSLLFVDEPTSGLDSFMAETIVLQMRDLARKGRTVIATIHQPSSELFEIFDKLYLLVDGHTVYDGKAADSITYFAAQGLQCPTFMNPSDFFMKQLVAMDEVPESKTRVQSLIEAWKTRDGKEAHQIKRKQSLADLSIEDEVVGELTPGLMVQLRVLCQRNSLRLVRDAIGFKARIGSTIFITLMIGLIFRDLKQDQKGIQDFTGAIFFISVNQFFGSANPEFISVPLEIPLVLREHNGRIYNVLTWYLAKNISELPFQVFFPILFLVPCYFLVGFGNSAEIFFSFYLFVTLLSSCATGLGYMVSCLAKRVDIAPIIGILFILPFLLFGGLFLNSASTPAYFIWLQQISPIKYCFHGLMRAFWTHVKTISCDPAKQQCLATTGTTVLANNSVKLHHLWFDCMILAILNLAFRLVGAFFLWRKTEKRSMKA